MDTRIALRRAFTLIELLIVVAIIAILAAIAVPNFLEAQTRSKASRAKTDMRSTAVALEAYAVDNNHYPPPIGYAPPAPFTIEDPAAEAFEGFTPFRITTPIAYIATLPIDVFAVAVEDEHPQRVCWHYSEQENNASAAVNAPEFIRDLALLLSYGGAESYRYFLFSHGPDLKHQDGSPENGNPAIYDPTNGTISSGDIYYFGPSGGFR
jgi:prepilin-type N-terminal cleavage/methylation domain-containing protein